MTFLTSILLGLCMGSSVYFSIQFGRQDPDKLRSGIFQAFLLIGAITLVLNALVYALVDPILLLLQIPPEVTGLTKTYLLWVFAGIVATFLYNFFANLLRAVGNSVTPLLFLGISVVLNIGLDLLFVVPLQMGVQGAALATVISQYLAGLGLAGYTWKAFPALRVRREDRVWNKATLRQLLSLSGFTCLQQSVMNFGILMVQGLVNSFGTTVMAAFAVAVKIDTLAYMPVQDFGNAFSTFVAQNFGAQKAGPDPQRHPVGGVLGGGVLPGAGGSGMPAGPPPHGSVRGGRGGGCHRRGHRVPAHRGGLLPGHWHPLPALWVLPGGEPAGGVGGAHGVLPGHPGGLGLCPLRPAGPGGYGDLDGHSHRLVFCRSGGHPPLAAGRAGRAADRPRRNAIPICKKTRERAQWARSRVSVCRWRGWGIRPPRAPKSA